MKAKDAVRKTLVTVEADARVHTAAKLMDEHAVGALVVTSGDEFVGIVTDRDLVTRGYARDLPSDARVDGLMSADLVTMPADADLRDALPIFRTHAFRRLPLTEGGKVVAMLTVDDLLIDLVADLGDVVRPITGEVIFGHPEPKGPDDRRLIADRRD